MILRSIIAVLGLLCAGALAAADTRSGREVVVVYNSRVPESREIAEHYAALRGVPQAQVIGLPLSSNHEITRAEYKNTLERPLAKVLMERKLWAMDRVRPGGSTNVYDPPGEWRTIRSSIRYAVLCYGVPYRILQDPELKEPGTDTWQPQLRRNEAAVDSELALLPQIERNLVIAGPFKNPHYLSTNSASLHPTNGLLMVTRLDGPSPAIAKALVDKALQAEKDGLWGRGYFDIRSITVSNYIPGDTTIRLSSEICRRIGFETVVDTNSATFPPGFPMSQIGVYVGWYDETVSGPLAQPNVEFMPGAFAYHLHSFSAAGLRSTNRNWVGPLLARGVTASMGAVDEPYLGGTPDMAVFIGRFLYEGFTFGEAAYAAQTVLSWQITIVGDPLYCPAARNQEELQKDLAARNSPLLAWSYLRLINLNLAAGRTPAQAAAVLESLAMRARSAILTEKLASLYDALGKPSSSLETYKQALQLDPSPLQRVRLRQAIGEKLEASGELQQAHDNYAALLQEVPQYAGRPEIQRRIDSLSERLASKTSTPESAPQ